MYKQFISCACFLFLFALFVRSAQAQVKINEFSAHSTPEWVEFYNASSSAEYLKSYYIDDDENFSEDSGSSAKKILTNLVTDSNTFPHIDLSSVLNNDGDTVVLFDNAGTIVDKYTYSKDPGENVSIGRYPDNTGDFYTLTSQTKDNANTGPIPTPVPTTSPKPTSTPNASPVSTSTPTPSVSPVASPKKPSPSPSSKVLSSPEPSSDILGETTNEVVSTDSAESLTASTSAENQGSFPFGIIMVITGILLSGGAGFLAFRVKKPRTPV